MREIPFVKSAKVVFTIHLSPPATPVPLPPPAAAAANCDDSRCPWWPYSNSKEFKASTALVFVFLLGTLICGLGLNSIIRYLCTRRSRSRTETPQNRKLEQEREIPAVIYSEEMKLGGAEAECAICLSEFAIGEKIRAMEKCGHGFHAECIERWLVSRSSCPTCRTNSQ